MIGGMIQSANPTAKRSRPWRIVGIVLVVVALALAFKPNYVMFHGRRRFCGMGLLSVIPADPWPPGDPRRPLLEKCQSADWILFMVAVGSVFLAVTAFAIDSYGRRSPVPRRPDFAS